MAERKIEIAQRFFQRSLEIPPEQRDEWLKGNCEDSSIRGEVKSLLRFHEQSQTLLDHPFLLDSQEASPVVGGYQLHEPLGTGGQGVVYRATKESTGRQVAIKVLRIAEPWKMVDHSSSLTLFSAPQLMSSYYRDDTNANSPPRW